MNTPKKANKRLLWGALILAFILAFVIYDTCTLSASEASQLVDDLTSSSTFSSESSATISKFADSEKLSAALLEKIEHAHDENSIPTIWTMMDRLNAAGYENTEVHNAFVSYLADVSRDALKGTGNLSSDDYIELVSKRLTRTPSISIKECFPYASVAEFIEQPITRENSDVFFELLRYFDENEYILNDYNELFMNYVAKLREAALSNDPELSFTDYCRDVTDFFRNVDNSNYVAIIEFFPYEAMLNYINNNCSEVTWVDGNGGYYDEYHDKYSNRSGTISPLGTGNGVGSYTYSTKYTFLGDFLYYNYSKRWYGTSASDPNNENESTLYFRDTELGSYLRTTTQDFMELRKTGTTYYTEVSPDSQEYVFFILGKDVISVFDGYNMLFTIQYS